MEIRRDPDPGSRGEHELQRRYQTQERAGRFYRQQVLDRLNEPMVQFIGRQEMVWIATADARGGVRLLVPGRSAGLRPRAGRPDRTVSRVPGQRGHGLARQHRREPPRRHGFPRFDQERIGLHVNGTARLVEAGGNGHGAQPRVERWVEVRVQEAYIHCRKHLPHLVRVNGKGRDWGTDDVRAKGGDYFGAACQARPATPG